MDRNSAVSMVSLDRNHGARGAIGKGIAFLAILVALVMVLPFGSADILDEDPDGDGYSGEFSRPGEEFFTTAEEYENETNPFDSDSDDDLMPDGWEVRWDFDPNDASDSDLDADGDGVSNLDEYFDDTNPRDVDLDHDGIPDIWEDLHGLNSSDPNDAALDSDGDGLTNYQEFLNRTLPFDVDTDDDGMWDGWEVENGFNPRNANDAPQDSDHGGVTNLGEFNNGTDPWDPADDFGNAGGGNGGSGVPTGDGVPPDTGRTDTEVTIINVFEPPLGALKRWQVLDGLGSDYLIFLRDNTTTPLAVSGGDYDHIFYGALNVTLIEGVYFRIPNPTPDSVLLSYYFENASVEFFKDPADNYYVLADYDADPDTIGSYVNTLYFTFGTDGAYFDLDIPAGLTTADEPVELLPDISSNVRTSVQYFLDTVDEERVQNLDGETSLSLIVTNLTGYFSNFTEGTGDVPNPSGNLDIYETIALNKIGACRHRAFAFFVTANTLGVPTRYVANEAHCFVEVYIPNGSYSDSNWHRINLGGAGETNPGEPRPPDPPGSMETVIELGPIPAELYMGDPFTITGNISTLNGTPLAYHPFWVMAGSIQITTGSTDSMGNISMEIILLEPALGPDTMRLITAPYNGYLSNTSNNRAYTLYTDVLLHPTLPLIATAGEGTTIYVAGYLSSVNGTVLPRENVTLSWNGTEVDRFVTTDQGEFNLSHIIGGTIAPGPHKILLIFTGYDYYLGSNYTSDVTAKATEVWMNATVEPSSQDASALVYVTGRIEDGDGNNVSDRGSLMIMLHGIELVNGSLSNFTDAGGKDFNATVRIPATLSRGDYILHVRFQPDGGEDLASAYDNIDLYVDKITTYVYLFPGIIEIGERYTINGTLYSGSGIHVPGSIALYWEGEYLTTVTVDANGDFSYQNITRHDPGPLEIGAYFNGSEMFTPSFSVVNYSVFSYTSITAIPNPAEGLVTRNRIITITGRLLDDNSNNIENATIILYATDSIGHEDLIMEVTTDENGYTVQYNLSSDFIPGTLELELLFRKEGYYRGTSTILVYDVFAFTFFDVDFNTNVRAGTNLTMNGTFFDDMGHMLNLPISISFLGENHIPDLLDGNFSWSYPILLTQVSGEYPLILSFDRMNNYESSELNFDIQVYHLTTITPNILNLTRGTTESFLGVVRDELGNGIPSLDVDIFLRGEYLTTVTTDVVGNYAAEVLLANDLDLGPANVTIRVLGNADFLGSQENYTIAVYADTSIQLVDLVYSVRSQLNLQGSLYDNRGTSLPGLNISITFNSETINLTTDGNGSFHHKYRENITLGFYTFSVQFPAHEYYHMSQRSILIHVVSPLIISLEYRNDAIAGEGFVIAGTVLDDRGNPANVELNATLSSAMDVFWKYPAAINGQFNTTWTLNGDRIPGDYILYINNSNPYPNTHYLPSSNATTVFMTRATFITLVLVDGVRGESVTIEGNLSDLAGNPITFSDVRITFGNKIFNRTTDNNGDFLLSFVMPEDATPGPNTVTVYYEGNLTLEPIKTSGTLLVYVPTSVIMYPSHSHWSLVNINGTVIDNLGNNVDGNIVLYFAGGRIGQVNTDQSGFDATYPYRTIGRFESVAQFVPYTFTFYLESFGSTNHTLFAYYKLKYEVNSTITDTFPEEFGLENPVLAGEDFNFTLNATSDLGVIPTDILLQLGFGIKTVDINSSNTRTLFDVDSSLVPQEDHTLTIRDRRESIYFKLYPDPTEILINVVHPTRITADQEQRQGALTITGEVLDGRPGSHNVANGELNVTLWTEVLNFAFEDGKFEYKSDVSDRWGPENYTIVYPTNQYYLGSQKNFTVYIKAFTNLSLSVPGSLKFGESFKGTVKLTLPDGTPVSDAVVLLTMTSSLGSDQITVITGDDGTRTFQADMDTNESVSITAEFGGTEHFYPSSDKRTIKFDPDDDDGIGISSFFSGRAFMIYLLLGGIGFYIWRRKQIKYLMSLVHDSALRLDSGENPRSVVIIAYNLMCRHLRRFSIIRKDHETVSEFKGMTQKRMKLSEDGIGDLTNMMEYADYSDVTTNEGQKERAVRSLRSVERDLAGLGSSRRGRR